MAPFEHVLVVRQSAGPIPANSSTGNWRAVATDEDLVLESWSQGLIVGALMIMACITIANMRRGVLLHKLIFAEQLLAMTHGTFCFMSFDGYGWYLSSTAALLYCSWIMHNTIAWLKIKPFFSGRTIFKRTFVRWTRRIYVTSLACTVPPIIFQIYNNFRFFNGYNGWYPKVRPYEPLLRDPWWIFTCGILFHVLGKVYGMGTMALIKRSPRFGILLCAIALATIFSALDIVSSIHSFTGTTDGINPWWKLSLVFKCLTDTIMLDDFKTELKRLGIKRIKRDEKRRASVALIVDDTDDIDSDSDTAHRYADCDTPSTPRVTGNPSSVDDDVSPSRRDSLISPKYNTEEVEFGDALKTDPNLLNSIASVGDSRPEPKPRLQVGRGGIRGSHLPSLKGGIFEAIKPGKKKGKRRCTETEDGNENANEHLEHARRLQAETAAELQRTETQSSSYRRLNAFRMSVGAVESLPG